MEAKSGVDIERRYTDRPDLERQAAALLALLKYKKKPAVEATGKGDRDHVRSTRG